MNDKGVVYLVGAGPGDPELLTIKGERLLKECQVVIYDRLVSNALLDLVPKECEKIYVGKEVGIHSRKQPEINEIIVKKALEGKRVVRLKGGDPFVFGRGGEEVLALQEASIPYEVIPGITSAIAAATYAGIPITHRGISRSFHVITGHTNDNDNQLVDNFETLAKLEGTLVFLMGMSNLVVIVEQLCKNGKDINTPVAIISNATTYQQETVKGTLVTIVEIVKESGIKAPAVIVIGDVVRLDMRATINGSLSKTRIGVTGTKKLTDKLATRLREQGADVENLNFLSVKEYDNNVELKEARERLEEYTWIIFTSTNGVDIFFQNLKENQIDYRKLSRIQFAAVGSGTKSALLQHGYIADYVPTTYSTVALANGLVTKLIATDKLLIPRAEKGSEDLTRILLEHSVKFDDVKIYDIEIEKDKYNHIVEQMDSFDYLTFASASGVDGFFCNIGTNHTTNPIKTKIICIGDITAKRLADYGYKDCIVAGDYSVSGIVDSIVQDQKGDQR